MDFECEMIHNECRIIYLKSLNTKLSCFLVKLGASIIDSTSEPRLPILPDH